MEDLEKEVHHLCGERYKHTANEHHRWGFQKGSIVLGNQHVAIEKSRVQNIITGKEVPLKTYQRFQDLKIFAKQAFVEGLKKVSQRDYKKGLSTIANSFGLRKVPGFFWQLSAPNSG